MRVLGGRDTRSIAFLDEGVIGLELIPDDPNMVFKFASTQMPKDSKSRPAVLKRASDLLSQMPHTHRELKILSGDINFEKRDFESALADLSLIHI